MTDDKIAETARHLLAERRERIATAAMSGLIGRADIRDDAAAFACVAVALADALIAELDKETQT